MIPEIDQNTFAARLAEGAAFVVDVREAREYRPGHVPGAQNLPLSVLPARLPELPKDRPVEFRIHTKDVLHSFWVPEFRLKSDAVPGLTTKIRVTPNRIGNYQVVCAELCGIGHSTMRQNVPQ